MGEEARHLFVCRLPLDIREDELKQIFGTYGKVESAVILQNSLQTKAASAFVNYADVEAATDALEVLDGVYKFRTDPDCEAIRVSVARRRRDKGGGKGSDWDRGGGNDRGGGGGRGGDRRDERVYDRGDRERYDRGDGRQPGGGPNRGGSGGHDRGRGGGDERDADKGGGKDRGGRGTDDRRGRDDGRGDRGAHGPARDDRGTEKGGERGGRGLERGSERNASAGGDGRHRSRARDDRGYGEGRGDRPARGYERDDRDKGANYHGGGSDRGDRAGGYDRDRRGDADRAWDHGGRDKDSSWGQSSKGKGKGDEGRKIYVANLPTDIDEESMEIVFKNYGRLEDVFIMRQKQSHGKLSAFVTYESKHDAKDCIAAMEQGYEIRPGDGEIICKMAQKKDEGGAGWRSRPY